MVSSGTWACRARALTVRTAEPVMASEDKRWTGIPGSSEPLVTLLRRYVPKRPDVPSDDVSLGNRDDLAGLMRRQPSPGGRRRGKEVRVSAEAAPRLAARGFLLRL